MRPEGECSGEGSSSRMVSREKLGIGNALWDDPCLSFLVSENPFFTVWNRSASNDRTLERNPVFDPETGSRCGLESSETLGSRFTGVPLEARMGLGEAWCEVASFQALGLGPS